MMSLTPAIPPIWEVFFIHAKPFYLTPKFFLSIGGAGLLLLFLLISFNQPSQQTELLPLAESNPQEAENPLPETQTLIVEIKGAIANPGVYEMPAASRLVNLIEIAGGLLPDSDSNQINQAALLTDEDSIYIPTIGEETIESAQEQSLIDINSADLNALQTLPGIGPAKAQAIITFRESTPFTSVDDLNQVDGIGDKTLEQLQPLIRVK